MFITSQKKYDALEEKYIAEQTENALLREKTRSQLYRITELECKLAEYVAKEKKRSEQARRAANIRHHGIA